MAAGKFCASSSPPTPPAAGPHGSRRAPIFSAAWPAWRPASSTPTRTTCTSTWRSTSATRLIRSISWNSCRPASTTRPRYSSRRCWPSPWPPRCGSSAQAASPRRRSCSCGPSAGRLFAHDQWGDYLIYQLYPAHKVFVDGRSDFYGDDFEEKCIDGLNVKYGWEKTLTGFGVDTVLLPPNAPLSGALKESSRWRVVYDDGVALVFRSASRTTGLQVSVANNGGGDGRDREVTKTLTSDPVITETKPKT